MHALRADMPDGYLARYEAGAFRIVADGSHFTNEMPFDVREEFCMLWRSQADASRGRESTKTAISRGTRDCRSSQSGKGRMARRNRL